MSDISTVLMSQKVQLRVGGSNCFVLSYVLNPERTFWLVKGDERLDFELFIFIDFRCFNLSKCCYIRIILMLNLIKNGRGWHWYQSKALISVQFWHGSGSNMSPETDHSWSCFFTINLFYWPHRWLALVISQNHQLTSY